MAISLLRTYRGFRLLLSASAISNLGDGVTMVALPWLATLLSHDALMISAVAMAGRLPWLLFALPAGVWTDRADRRRLMVRADLVRFVLTLGVVGMIVTAPTLPLPPGSGSGTILALIAMSFLLGTAEVFHDNAAQTVLPALVPAEALERANGQMWSAEQVMSRFAGPPLAGVLIGAGIALPFGFDATSFALAAGLVALIVLPAAPLPPALQPFGPALREGLRWMRAHPEILRLAVMLGAINAVFMAGMAMLVLYAQEVLGLSAAAYGLLLTAGAAGGVLGGMAAPGIARRLGPRASLQLALASFAVLNLLLGLFSAVPLAALALFVEAMSSMLWNVVTVSYRQRRIPDALLGRVNSVYRFFGWGAMPFGALAGGAMVAGLQPQVGRLAALHAPFLVSAAVCLGLLVYGALRLRLDEK